MLKNTGEKFNQGTILQKIIYINLTAFLCYSILVVLDYLFETSLTKPPSIIIQWFALPPNISDLIQRIWTIFTYMFFHQDFWHLFFNLFGLYFVGRLFLKYLNEKQFLTIYILGGVSSGLLFIICFNLFPNLLEKDLPLIGASGSIFAILLAISTYIPQTLLAYDIKIKHVAIFLVLFNFCYIPWDPGACIAHLGGALFGYFYTSYLKADRSVNWITRLMDIFSNKGKLQTIHKRAITDQEFRNKKTKQKKEVDSVLEKIAKSGYESLTSEEKNTLFNESKK